HVGPCRLASLGTICTRALRSAHGSRSRSGSNGFRRDALGQQKAAVDFVERTTAAERHREIDLASKMLEHGEHAISAVERQSPEHGTAHEHGARAERQRAQDVDAASYATV